MIERNEGFENLAAGYLFPEVAKRRIDFLGGTIYAIEGKMQKLGNGIFLCAPNNFNIEGKISEGEKQVQKSKKEEQELDW